MDPLAELLTDVRARSALFTRADLRPPWALRIATGTPLTVATMLRGKAWIVRDHGEPVAIGPHDIALVRGTTPTPSPTTRRPSRPWW